MRPLLSLLLIGLSLIGIQSFFSVVSSAPAFHGALREADVYGNHVPVLSKSMYDYPVYLMQVGTSFVRADLLPTGDTESLGEYADTDLALERAEQAVSLLTRSLQHGPSDAMAWETLAWAYFMSGDPERAHRALEASWTLAPYNARLANQRLSLYAGLAAVAQRTGTPLTLDTVTAFIKQDLQTLEVHNQDDYAFHVTQLDPSNQRP